MRREHWALALILTLLLLAAIPPLINLGRFQHRIAGSVSRSIGRPIAFRALSFRLLPWPALLFQDFAVDEDPRFGFEPALRAPQVTATPSFTSLWRGRFELARVELSSPSVNLVRNPDGRWSVGALLLQASRAPNAPTGSRRPGPAPRFPYITATDARINLKRGAEKLPYSLLDADFSMSLASPGTYSLKLEGRPVRTDVVLSANDTGTLRIKGEVHRASAFGAMPLNLYAEWKDASLSQLSQLVSGRDGGWRALVDASAELTGDLDRLFVRTRIVAANLHRQEFTPERTYTVDARCRGLYSRADPSADAFSCRWPLGAGALTLASSALPAQPAGQNAPAADRTYTLGLDRIPADVLAATLGLLRQNMPAPARFTGELSGGFLYRPADRGLTGSAALPHLTLADAGLDGTPLAVEDLRLTAPTSITQPELTLTAAPVEFGVPGHPVAFTARFSPRVWAASASGGAALKNLQALAAAFRIPTLDRFSPAEHGPAQAEFTLAFDGGWFSDAPSASGVLSAAGIRWQPPWLPFPIDLTSASASLASGLARWELHAVDAGPLHLTGTAQVPSPCELPAFCLTRFALRTPVLNAAALESALTGNRPELVQALLRRFQSRTRLPAFLGTIHADILQLGLLPVRDAQASLSSGAEPSSPADAINLNFLSGSALGGSIQMQGALSLAGTLPAYRVHAALARVSAAEAAAMLEEHWPQGTLSGSADFTLSGAAASSLTASLSGTWQAAWLNGSLGRGFATWEAAGSFTPSGLQITRGLLTPSGDAVTGTIGWDRTLHLRLSPPPDGAPTTVTGTLAHPLLDPAAIQRH